MVSSEGDGVFLRKASGEIDFLLEPGIGRWSSGVMMDPVCAKMVERSQ